jgi:hypothetical protein
MQANSEPVEIEILDFLPKTSAIGVKPTELVAATGIGGEQ